MTAIKKVLLAPLDPVHDIGLKIMKRYLDEKGFSTILLPPDLKAEEIIQKAIEEEVDAVLISRTLGYRVAEMLANFVDLADAAGLRDRAKLVIGGKAIRPELAAELGFDAGFGPGTEPEELIAFLEDRPYIPPIDKQKKDKKDLCQDFSYRYRHARIKEYLDQIVDDILIWAGDKTSPGVERALVREKLLEAEREYETGKMSERQWNKIREELLEEYLYYADDVVKQFYREGKVPAKSRQLTQTEIESLEKYVQETEARMSTTRVQHVASNPTLFIQYGTGCPFMDIAHIKIAESWGADGVIHFDPSWGARTEGLLEGYLTHEEDGSIITQDNLRRIRNSLSPSTLWQVRAHRGLNTPETVLLAGYTGADLTKINIAYGSLGAGTDPERMCIDGIAAIKYAARFGMPFDVVTNEELCGVPAYKAFAGMLIVAHLTLRLGGKPILQPLFCYSPEMMIYGGMKDNYVDFNAAKISALREIIDAPIWPGAPIGFLTHTEDRVQSSVTTALHAALASSLGVVAISIASSDEAYSGGPIVGASRVDTLQAVKEVFRFFGSTSITPTGQAEEFKGQIIDGIESVLKEVLVKGSFVRALYEGVLGSREDGAYPGRVGRGTVIKKKAARVG
ncbi:cobalamin B12-binding domain-containing protein [Calderihabitans maritimus]|uniref:cobalamin B12-binding domain-containing protein n=1 Tax=Calderihabitans maritimus TaxID=1246530 RepID=UPI000B5142AF|nr:cobalamin-dependent protein [Calderihabitans maritimus]